MRNSTSAELSGWVLKNIPAVHVKSLVPEAKLRHEALGALQLALAAPDGLDKLDAGVLVKLGST